MVQLYFLAIYFFVQVVDHTTHDFLEKDGVIFVVED